jgi:zinc-binding alcohol dehydrogenase family protein
MTTTTRALASYDALPVTDPDAFVEVELPVPELGPRDLLVEVHAVSVNPVDVKRRAGIAPGSGPTVLGYDASGVVAAVGPEVGHYAVGDPVYYAGDVTRRGSNAQHQAVDERIVGRKPATLSHAEAAAMPLTTITAWEVLFDKFELVPDATGALLVMAGASGVGSVLTQLAKRLTELTVVATGGREDSRSFATRMGADAVVDRTDLAASVLAVAPGGTDYVFTSYPTGTIDALAEIARPFSQIASIDGVGGLDLSPLFAKSISWHYEFMFTRSMFDTDDIGEQRRLLNRAADLLDDGTLITTATTVLDGFTPDSLREAHRLIETGRTIGKVVITR